MAANKSDVLQPWQPGIWRFRIPQGQQLIAGVTDRLGGLEELRACLPVRGHADGGAGGRRAWDASSRRLRRAHPHGERDMVLAGQVHGASVAVVDMSHPSSDPITGCDGLTTRRPGLALVIRTADCLPILIWDPVRQVVGLMHAGWRGLASHLPMRVVSFVQRFYRSHSRDLVVGIGPAIRACCYEVGEGFESRFGPFVREEHGRRTCDLIGCATEQLVASGVRPRRVVDSGQCTYCSLCPGVLAEGLNDAKRWHSVRRDGESGGRLLSFAMIRPYRSLDEMAHG